MYEIKQSPIDQQHYAVFKNEDEAVKLQDDFKHCNVACFDGYYNAFRVSSAWCP